MYNISTSIFQHKMQKLCMIIFHRKFLIKNFKSKKFTHLCAVFQHLFYYYYLDESNIYNWVSSKIFHEKFHVHFFIFSIYSFVYFFYFFIFWFFNFLISLCFNFLFCYFFSSLLFIFWFFPFFKFHFQFAACVTSN